MTSRAAGFILSLVIAAPAVAQTPTTELRLVVVDETGAGIPSATIVVTPAAGEPITFITDERGAATSPALPAGAAKIAVEFPGFESYAGALTLRRGAMNQTVTLKVAGFTEDVVVSASAAAPDTRGAAVTLEADDIAQLPDDPDELSQLLTQMAGGSATFQVNGFRGGRLPSPSEIQQIRIRSNAFSADNHDAGRASIEIITRPNVQEWDGNFNTNLRSDLLNARNAFARAETPEQTQRFNFGLRGPLVAGKTALRLNFDGNRGYESGTIFALNENGSIFSDTFRRPTDTNNVTIGLEHVLTPAQTLRLELRRGESARSNVGIGDFTLAERASSSQSRDYQLRAQVQGVVRGKMLHEIRVQYNGQTSAASSATSGPSINVLDAFNRGGAGVNNQGSRKALEIADNLDFTVGRKHSMRVGLLFEAGHFANFDARNAAGTFTFSSLEAFNAGRPLQFTQRQGEVNTAFGHYQLGIYWQDDIRVSRNLTIGVGVRQEMQSLVGDALNLMPRAGFTWSLGTSVVRGGYGLFHDWYDASLHDQTLRVDGVSQRDLVILNPSYPDPFLANLDVRMLPGGRIQASPDLTMPYVHQASIGVERPLTANLQLQASYQMLRGGSQLRARNINAPDQNGVRPDPTVGIVTQFESTGRSQSDRLTLGMNYRVPQRGIMINGSYTLGQVLNHADSATQLPVDSLNPDAEWAPSMQDVRHRLQANINVPLWFGVRSTINTMAQSAAPFNITTGRDDNLDGVVNDRPEGVGRNAARGAARWDIGLRLGRAFGFGGPAQGSAPAQAQGRGGAGRPGGAQTGQRFSVELFANAQNLLNRVNYRSFVGNIQSPLFGQATGADQPRRVELGLQFRF